MVANCSVKEILERINKIQLLNDISNNSSTVFEFPKRLRPTHGSNTVDILLPTFSEILDCIEASKTKAITDSISLGLLTDDVENVSLMCGVIPFDKQKAKNVKPVNSVSNVDIVKKYSCILSQLKNTSLKNFSEKFLDRKVDEASSYLEIYGGKKKIVIKKTSLVWLLRSNLVKLSSDRLQRVMTKDTPKIQKPLRKKTSKKMY